MHLQLDWEPKSNVLFGEYIVAAKVVVAVNVCCQQIVSYDRIPLRICTFL